MSNFTVAYNATAPENLALLHESSPDPSLFLRVEPDPNWSRQLTVEISPPPDSEPEKPDDIPANPDLIWTLYAALPQIGTNAGDLGDNGQAGDNVAGQADDLDNNLGNHGDDGRLEDDEQDDHFYEVQGIVIHYVDNNDKTVELLVKWEGYDDLTREPESSMQTDAPVMVYEYWSRLGGRFNATGLDRHHVFKILDHKDTVSTQGRLRSRRYKVQWVGYPPNLSTWELSSKIRRCAPVEKAKYDAEKGL